MKPVDPSSFRDSDFVKKLQNLDPEALKIIANSYSDQLLRAALGLGFDENSALDLIQNVWQTFLNIIPRFEGRSHVRTFLFGILYKKAAEQRRLQIKIKEQDPIDDIMESKFSSNGHWITPPLSPERFLQSAEVLKIIQDCVERLPSSQRLIFQMREVDELETQEICKNLDVSATHMSVLLFRAKNRLRECIEKKSQD